MGTLLYKSAAAILAAAVCVTSSTNASDRSRVGTYASNAHGSIQCSARSQKEMRGTQNMEVPAQSVAGDETLHVDMLVHVTVDPYSFEVLEAWAELEDTFIQARPESQLELDPSYFELLFIRDDEI